MASCFPDSELTPEQYLTVIDQRYLWVSSLEEEFRLDPRACTTSPAVCGVPPGISLPWLMEAFDVVYMHHKSINGGKQGFMLVECDELDCTRMESQAVWSRLGWPSQGRARFEKTGQITRLCFNSTSDTPVVLRTEIMVERIDELGTVDTFCVLKIEGVKENNSRQYHALNKIWQFNSENGVQTGFIQGSSSSIALHKDKSILTFHNMDNVPWSTYLVDRVEEPSRFYVNGISRSSMLSEGSQKPVVLHDAELDFCSNKEEGPKFEERYIADNTQCLYHIWVVESNIVPLIRPTPAAAFIKSNSRQSIPYEDMRERGINVATDPTKQRRSTPHPLTQQSQGRYIPSVKYDAKPGNDSMLDEATELTNDSESVPLVLGGVSLGKDNIFDRGVAQEHGAEVCMDIFGKALSSHQNKMVGSVRRSSVGRVRFQTGDSLTQDQCGGEQVIPGVGSRHALSNNSFRFSDRLQAGNEQPEAPTMQQRVDLLRYPHLPMPSQETRESIQENHSRLYSALSGNGLQLDRSQEDDAGKMDLAFRSAPLQLQSMFHTDSGLQESLSEYCNDNRRNRELRGYQERAVARAETGENIIYIAPTGSGKTKIFVEAARRLLRKNKRATVIVLSPTIPLANQNAGVFVVEGFIKEGFKVNAFSSQSPLPGTCWNLFCLDYSVMTMTPAILLNLLTEGFAAPKDIQLLIFDECHHCKGEHQYAKVMEIIRDSYKTSVKCHRTQVLGFTASPAAKTTLQETHLVFSELCEKMAASFEIISENDEEVQLYAPTPCESTKLVQLRDEDYQFVRTVATFLVESISQFIVPLLLKLDLSELPPQFLSDISEGQHSTIFEHWWNQQSNQLGSLEISEEQKLDLLLTFRLLIFLNNMLDLVREAGVEACLTSIIPFAQALRAPGENMLVHHLYFRFIELPPMNDPQMLARAEAITIDDAKPGFPKFLTLVEFLLQFKSSASVHGIVFVKTRNAVTHLARMLRSFQPLRHMKFFEFIGHGSQKKKRIPKNMLPKVLSSMSSMQQQSALEAFSKPGFHVLISTSIGEEGINMPKCEFVVRYAASVSGTVRVQSRGRTRVHGGQYLNIVEAETQEHQLLMKSIVEEQHMQKMLRIIPT